MESIKDKVAIVGMGTSQFGELWEKGVDDLIVDAATEAFEDAGVEPKDIQAAWFGTFETGLTGQLLSSALQLQGKAEKPERQLKNPRIGLVHNQGGHPGRFMAGVCIIGAP